RHTRSDRDWSSDVCSSDLSTRVPNAAERASVTDPISQSLLQFWPAPTNPNASTGSNNFIANVGATTFDETGLAKVDYNFTKNDRLTARWAQYGGTVFTPGALPLVGGNANSPGSDSGVLDYTHTFSARFLDAVRFGFSRNKTVITAQDSGFKPPTSFVDANGNALPCILDASTDELDCALPTIGIGCG